MFCRMNRAQREALIDLIDAKVIAAVNGDSYNIAEVHATDCFHNAFQNECEIDDEVNLDGE